MNYRNQQYKAHQDAPILTDLEARVCNFDTETVEKTNRILKPHGERIERIGRVFFHGENAERVMIAKNPDTGKWATYVNGGTSGNDYDSHKLAIASAVRVFGLTKGTIGVVRPRRP